MKRRVVMELQAFIFKSVFHGFLCTGYKKVQALYEISRKLADQEPEFEEEEIGVFEKNNNGVKIWLKKHQEWIQSFKKVRLYKDSAIIIHESFSPRIIMPKNKVPVTKKTLLFLLKKDNREDLRLTGWNNPNFGFCVTSTLEKAINILAPAVSDKGINTNWLKKGESIFNLFSIETRRLPQREDHIEFIND